uniref:Uncharacterized protein n=1 Tax=Setaria viridis TaxID=4556 RepID=A0A4U6TZD3_SETVI|nr:hypothetical protein SEVIR_6G026750v2 [Setaria viridis]
MTAPLLARCIASPPSSPRCVSPRWSRRGVSPCRAVAAPTGRSCSPIAPSQVDRWRRSRSSHGKGRRVPAAGKPPTFRSTRADPVMAGTVAPCYDLLIGRFFIDFIWVHMCCCILDVSTRA